MIGQIFKSFSGIFNKPKAKIVKNNDTTHTFKKHPMQHADKAIKAAFKVGFKTGTKFKK